MTKTGKTWRAAAAGAALVAAGFGLGRATAPEPPDVGLAWSRSPGWVEVHHGGDVTEWEAADGRVFEVLSAALEDRLVDLAVQDRAEVTP